MLQILCFVVHRNNRMKLYGLNLKNIDTKKGKFNKHFQIQISNFKLDLRVTLLQGDYC